MKYAKAKIKLCSVYSSVTNLLGIISPVSILAINKKERKIVLFNNTIEDIEVYELIKKHGAEKIKKLQGINGVVVNISKDNKLKFQKEVKYVEDDFTLTINKNPSKGDDATPNPLPEIIP